MMIFQHSFGRVEVLTLVSFDKAEIEQNDCFGRHNQRFVLLSFEFAQREIQTIDQFFRSIDGVLTFVYAER